MMKQIHTEVNSTWPSAQVDSGKIVYSTGVMGTAVLEERFVTMYRLKGDGRILRERTSEPTQLEITQLFKDNPDVTTIETEKVYKRRLRAKNIAAMLDEAYESMIRLGLTPSKFYLSQTLYDMAQAEWRHDVRMYGLKMAEQIERDWARKYGTVQFYNDAEVHLLEEESDTGTLTVVGVRKR